MRYRTWIFGILALPLIAAPALAGPVEDCALGRIPRLRLKSCTQVIATHGFGNDEKGRAYRTRAGLRLEAGAAAEAVADYTQAMRLVAPDSAVLSGRARARLVLNDTSGALADYNDALKLQPQSAGLYIARGHVHFVRGAAAASIADFTEALRLNPSSASAYNQRGLAYRRSGETAKAIADYTAAIDINPVYALAYNNRGYAHEALGRKDQAAADFRAALLLDASLVGARDALARLGVGFPAMADTARLIARGRDLVARNCASCHAIDRNEQSPNPKSPPFRSLATRHSGLSLREPLTRGIAAPHDQMPKFDLTTDDVDSIIAYINSLAAPASAAAKGRTSSSRWQTAVEAVELGDAAKGRIYATKMCQSCHNVTGSTARSPNPKSPTFKAIADTPGMTLTALTVWSRSTHTSMPNLIILADDLENLSAYLLTLKSGAN